MGCTHRDCSGSPLRNVGELWPPSSSFQDRSNCEDTLFSNLVIGPGSAMTSEESSLHSAASPDSVTTPHMRVPHPTSPAVGMASNSIDSSQHVSGRRAFLTKKEMWTSEAMSNAQAGKHSVQFVDCTNTRVNNSSSGKRPSQLISTDTEDSLSGHGSECAPLHVTRAGSDCSLGDAGNDAGLGNWCEQDLRLMAETLAEERSLLEVQHQLESRISNAEHEKMARALQKRHSAELNSLDGDREKHSLSSSNLGSSSAHNRQPKTTLQNSYEDMEGKGIFARQHFQKPHHLLNERTLRKTQEDPTVALQGRLQDLLLVARVSDRVHDQVKNVHPSLQLDSANLRSNFNLYEDGVFDTLGSKSLMKIERSHKRRDTEAAALRNELNSLSLELAEAREALACQKREACRSQTQQTVAEEMYCKETVQKLICQMHGEMEQWTEIQDILHNLQKELHCLSETQLLWEERAYQAEAQLLLLQKELHEWRCQARTAHEELVMLRCERQILKNRIKMMEKSQMSMPVANERLEEPRHANVGTQHGEFGPCESFMHSRNESGRSSVDLGSSSHRSFRNGIKKSMGFTNKENINSNKPWFANVRVPTNAGATALKVPSKKANVGSTMGDLKNQVPLAHYINVGSSTTKIDRLEHSTAQERKKARLFPIKDKLGGASNVGNAASNSVMVKDGLVQGHLNSSRDDADHVWSFKTKSSSLPSAPTSTPSRVLFGNIVNITKH